MADERMQHSLTISKKKVHLSERKQFKIEPQHHVSKEKKKREPFFRPMIESNR